MQSFIKLEPADDIQNEAEVEDDEEMDPSQFLARENENEEEETVNEEEGGGGPPILTSLGLTHINHVNPYSFLVSTKFLSSYSNGPGCDRHET